MNLEALLRLFERMTSGRGDAGFAGSDAYWRVRYARGGNAGLGSANHLAVFKAEVLNDIVSSHAIGSVIEFGCGEGRQLLLAKYPRYIGVDISSTALRASRRLFSSDPTKRFIAKHRYRGQRADATLSVDVIYHLVEDEVFESHMADLFDAAERFVVIYSSDADAQPQDCPPHVRHRRFSTWIERHRPEWRLISRIQNRYPFNGDPSSTSFCDFFLYQRSLQDAGDSAVLVPPPTT